MTISASQCRAARAMLDWSQDQLAENAQVARASVADFERNSRSPMKNNLLAIAAAFVAAGIEFIPDAADGTAGAGVRFRKVELEFIKNVRVNDDSIVIPVRFRGTPLRILVPRDVIDDLGGRFGPSAHPTQEQRIQIVQDRLPLVLCAAERSILSCTWDADDTIVLVHEAFPKETFG